MNKPTSLLLDADVIVYAHQFEVWERIKGAYHVHVSATVIDEARYFKSRGGRRDIDLKAQEAAGEIARLDADAVDVALTFKDFDPTFLAALHDGEKEAITILRARVDSGLAFCTGDVVAIQSVAMLGLSGSCLSFEELLQKAGSPPSRLRLPAALAKKAHDHHLSLGKTRRITGECFKNPPLAR